MRHVPLLAAPGALLLVLGCTVNVEPHRLGEAPLPALVAQRVTATIQREAPRLVRLETEREAFLTTPEHPFATPRSGWVSAGQLVPGDWVVSERFGAVRLLSARSEPAARPVPVFNLSVASSHAYFVGTDRVLVHNTNCKPGPSESTEDVIARLVRTRDELTGRITELTKTEPTSPLIAKLKAERTSVTVALRYRRKLLRQEQGVTRPSNDEQSRQRHEADNEAAQKELENTQKELADLEGRPPSTDAEKKAYPGRITKLKKRIESLTLYVERTNLIVNLLKELVELDKATPATDAERRAVEEKKKELRASLATERPRASLTKSNNKKRADPELYEEYKKYDREKKRRPHNELARLETELARLREAPPSPSRDERINLLTDKVESKKKLVEVLKLHHRIESTLSQARAKRAAEGGDSRELDLRIQQLERGLHEVKLQRTRLRVQDKLSDPFDTPGSLDEAQLREFQRQLAQTLVDPEQLERIEAALDAIEGALDAPTPSYADLQDAVLDEAHDVDESLREWQEVLRRSPSPERATDIQSSFEVLQQKLGEERAEVEKAIALRAREYAFIELTRPSSSSGPTWQERLQTIRQEQDQLIADWRARLSARLNDARQRREDMRRVPRLYDEDSDRALAREIDLLEQELRFAGGQP